MQTQLVYSPLAIGVVFANPIRAIAQSNIMRHGETYANCVTSALTDGLSTAAEEVQKATGGLGQFSKCILHGAKENTDNELAKRTERFARNLDICVSRCHTPRRLIFLNFLPAGQIFAKKSAEPSGESNEDTTIVLEKLNNAKDKIWV
ncbi:uncharacterized protein EURHEDRAFT_412241 [Aspergillus ruber CBS 135680]|uniref:Uncharacterized protein n=1 Tax=Aspergillus ruber (strain CBS 135680) TaxID=1388766 RepID=A0A017SEI1_ASPRC|nr:uncharacterized protein EURHEDRAFT_412241 [Aspergillus ruber CBS 135680]EYE95428.1 hypothetical protein EURHEDRAFT_412241 [Aspergillus ruber CBS 135680]